MDSNKKAPKSPLTKDQKRVRNWKRVLIVFATIAVLIILLHIFAPMIILHFVNKKMTTMPEYIGHVDRLSFNLFTASSSVGGITLTKRGGKIPVPFVDINRIDVSIDWYAVWKRRLVAKVEVNDFALNIVTGPTDATTQTKVDQVWLDFADEMMPLDINQIKANNSEVHYRNYHSHPKIDLFLDKIYAVAENLATVEDTTKVLPAKANVTANAYGGSLVINAKLNSFNKKIPDFDLSAKIKGLPLPYLNNLARAYVKMDVQKGWFSAYAEAAAKDGEMKGYAKLFVRDLDVIDKEERKGMSVKDQISESLVDFVGWVFENKKTDRIATKVKFEGKLTDPNISIWGLVGEILINAFSKALVPSLENSINVNSIGTKDDKNFLEKIFEPTEKQKARKKKRKLEREKKKQKKKLEIEKKKLAANNELTKK